MGLCKHGARSYNIVKASSLGEDSAERDGKGRHFGQKLEMVVRLIKEQIPEKERALVFVQFQDLTSKVAKAFEANHIKFLSIEGSTVQRSNKLQKFQEEGDERVLLLNLGDESASGANLTSANHVVFLSPLLVNTLPEYRAAETQAIGRVRRYGQSKTVHIYRFLTLDTIDIELYDKFNSDTQ